MIELPRQEFLARLDGNRNEKFSSSSFADAYQRFIASQFAYSSQHGFSSSAGEISDMERCLDYGDQLSSDLAALVEIARIRRSNLLREPYVHFVSLGHDCFTRVVLTRWGLKRTVALGELSCPFDLAVHHISAVNYLLENGFSDYMNPDFLAFHNDTKHFTHTKLRISFNHDSGEEYAESAFEKLRGVYTRRVENFQDIVKTADRVVYFLNINGCTEETETLLVRTKRALERISNRPANIFVLDHWPGAYVPKSHDIAFASIRRPTQAYVWHHPTDCFSAAGRTFEATVIRRLLEQMTAWGLNNPAPDTALRSLGVADGPVGSGYVV